MTDRDWTAEALRHTITHLTDALIVGYGVTGRAVALSLRRRGVHVVIIDDSPQRVVNQASADGLDVTSPSEIELREILSQVQIALPSPGVPQHHRSYALADELNVPIVSELDLAAVWDSRPIAAVTGTNGKTTVTTLVTTMLRRSGFRALATGNTDIPLVEAIDSDPDAQMFVVEASSFRLERARLFRPDVAVWLNLAPDHLDWHGDLASYAAAKARVWAAQTADDVAVIPADDPIVAEYGDLAPARKITFAGPGATADVCVINGAIVAHGHRLVNIAEMRRQRPHDISNACAAAAVALAMGADSEAISDELREFTGLPHRLQYVGQVTNGGFVVSFYNDSKATAPHATVAALRGFESAVLIAGGRNKDLDLSGLTEIAGHLQSVVAIGEAADEVAAVFTGLVRVETATSMKEAVEIAWRLATQENSEQLHRDVVLSPACASFDWYPNYGARGDDFTAVVAELADRVADPASDIPAVFPGDDR
ncbi:MAG: UDP-N-acetylmuramoylalanine--D-glutamate ligase [Candidatus Poriferisodalaceae bacterium]|jgi:UDP-N-acetylmuramoylalanine--D-glutamate ligase